MGSWGWMVFHGLFWLVVFVLLGRGIVLLMRQSARRPPSLDVFE